jgi:hypothetical protein
MAPFLLPRDFRFPEEEEKMSIILGMLYTVYTHNTPKILTSVILLVNIIH